MDPKSGLDTGIAGAGSQRGREGALGARESGLDTRVGGWEARRGRERRSFPSTELVAPLARPPAGRPRAWADPQGAREAGLRARVSLVSATRVTLIGLGPHDIDAP
jgi:hypothetical protein